MMEEQGLAAAIGGQGMGMDPRDGRGAQQMPVISVEGLVMMLKQGITPEELAQNGVPVELIDQAMMMLQQEVQAGAGQGQPVEQSGGLADMYMAQGAV